MDSLMAEWTVDLMAEWTVVMKADHWNLTRVDWMMM